MQRDRMIMLARELVADAVRTGGKVKVPPACQQLWAWFSDLTRVRTYHAAGPNPIGYAEIEAYARATGTLLRSQDVDALRALDEAFIVATLARRQAFLDGTLGPSAQPITPAIFDAVFG